MEWDPRICPECGDLDETSDEAVCRRCGETWNPEICPACGASEYGTSSLEEILYAGKTDGAYCRTCRRWWHQGGEGDEGRCPDCGSEEVEDARPEIPELPPELQLICAVESVVPRTEGGAILYREMVAWMRDHGVRSRVERLEWEKWLIAIAGYRAKVTAEMMEPSSAAKKKGDDEENGGY